MNRGVSTPAPVPRRVARECLLVNLLVFPGVGSLLAGRRVGHVQGVLALLGSVFMVVWLADFLSAWIRTVSFPVDGGSRLGLGLGGVGLFVAGWFWGLATGLHLRRQARHAIPPRLAS